MDVYVARQPIFDAKKNLFGYELLLRNGFSDFCPEMDGDAATSQLLANSFLTIGIERLSGPVKAFVNFTEELLVKRLPLMFPANKVVVEILEDVPPVAEVITACREMAHQGYAIALDDFLYRPELEPLVALADIIKFDFRASSAADIKSVVDTLPGSKPRLLAEKVETNEEFQAAKDLGFHYFQGYFFAKPQVIGQKDISSNQMNLLQIVAEANKDGVDFNTLEKLITRDVAIPYKLLRYINSAYFRRVSDIASIKQAITLLGENGTRRFLSLIAMARLAADKPEELIRASIIRARFCEKLAGLAPRKMEPSSLFTLGLFSLIDAILDDSMQHLMEKLPLSREIQEALLKGEGTMSGFLNLVRCYERADWKGISREAAALGVDEKALPRHYWEALEWADEFISL